MDIDEDILSPFDTWKNLVNSEDWQVFVDLLKEHEQGLNKQSLMAVEKREMEVAYGYRLRAIECNAIIRLVEGRLAELKKG